MFADPRTEWRINDIEQKLQRKADQHEVDSTRRDVDSLERANREIRSEADGLRSEVYTMQEKIDALTRILEELQTAKEPT